MKHRCFSLLLYASVFLSCAILYFSSNYVNFILAYVFSFVFLFLYAVFSASKVLEKIVQAIIYALIMVVQILFVTLVFRPLFEASNMISSISKILSVVLIFAPFMVRQIFFYKCSGYPFPAFSPYVALSYSALLHDKNELNEKIAKLKSTGEVFSKDRLQEILYDLPRHNSFSYVNNGSLTESYFQKAEETLDDGYIYLVITQSKSAASELIGLFTNKLFNHVSISFDKDLHTIISYNGGERIEPPGLNAELLERLTEKTGATILLYRLPATREQKKNIIDKVAQINLEGSAYNLIGLALKYSWQPNIMFCSQFVYTMLELAGLNYFEIKATHVKPTDFIELDYYRKLQFVDRIVLDNGVKKHEEERT